MFSLVELARERGKRGSLPPLRGIEVTRAIVGDLQTIIGESVKLWANGFVEAMAEYERPGAILQQDASDCPTNGGQMADAATVLADRTPSRMAQILSSISRRADETLIYQTARLGNWVTRVGKWHGEKTIAAAQAATGVNIRPYMILSDIQGALQLAIQENVTLIRGLNDRARVRAESIILQGFAQRRPKAWVADELAKALRITKTRAKLIARDQSDKLNAALTRVRNHELGITSYRWVTMGDDRVRPLHEARDGKVFQWRKPPSDGHPGEPINCRCIAEGILEDG